MGHNLAFCNNSVATDLSDLEIQPFYWWTWVELSFTDRKTRGPKDIYFLYVAVSPWIHTDTSYLGSSKGIMGIRNIQCRSYKHIETERRCRAENSWNFPSFLFMWENVLKSVVWSTVGVGGFFVSQWAPVQLECFTDIKHTAALGIISHGKR